MSLSLKLINIVLSKLIIYAMVVCRSHDTAGSLANGVFISRPTSKIQTNWQNLDPLAKYRHTGKIQTKWLGHKVVHIVTRNIKKRSLVFINILFICINLIKSWHKKKTIWLACAWGRTHLVVNPAASPSTFLTHLSTIRFFLIT